MTITAKVVTDSIGTHAKRLTTFQLCYPRFIHAEVMTHRVFSRNASSSRAVPVKKTLGNIMVDPAMPSYWGKNQPGMQATEECDEMVECRSVMQDFPALCSREDAWLNARDAAVEIAKNFDAAGYHKQTVNRLLEPFAHIHVVLTATEYDNFFSLRRHPDAQPEFKILADAMWEAREASTPKALEPRMWHLPYVTDRDFEMIHAQHDVYDPEEFINPWDYKLIQISVARCARVSYLTHDGKEPNIEKDIALFDRLVGSVPLHASPAEHQATPDVWDGEGLDRYPRQSERRGNFSLGWVQFRKLLPDENMEGNYSG